MTPEGLKAQLMAEAEATIDKILAKRSPANKITMREISQLAIESGQRLQNAVLQTLAQASASETGERGEAGQGKPVCQRYGKPMSYKGKRTRQVVSEGGETAVERDYYYCSRCTVGVFPPR